MAADPEQGVANREETPQMSPETAYRIVQAMLNERRPQRTLHDRVRDALIHVEHSKKCPDVDGVEAHISVGEMDGNGQENYSGKS